MPDELINFHASFYSRSIKRVRSHANPKIRLQARTRNLMLHEQERYTSVQGKFVQGKTGTVGLSTLERVADLIEVFKILNVFEGVEDELFKRHISNTMGHSMKLYKDRLNKDVLKFRFANRIFDQWSKLPERVISANSINCFKNNFE